MSLLERLLTKNYELVPLLFIKFNLQKFRQNGAKGSCDLSLHPCLRDDQYIIETMNGICDYIRENYDMEKLV